MAELSRTVAYSKTESHHILRHEDINGEERLFGGKLMAWIDEAATMTAIRHSGLFVTTASVDNLQFIRGAYLNDMVVLYAKLTYVGSTSMEVRVDTYLEEPDGTKHEMNRAHLTFVAVDEAGTPVKIPYKLELETEEEKAEWDAALKRKEYRINRKKEGF